MVSRRKLLVYTHAMTGGGAERVCASLASAFSQAGDEVWLAVDFESPDNAAYVDASVCRVALGHGHLRQVLSLARLLAREKPDVSLSALGVSNLKHLLAAGLAGRLSRAVISYHGFASSEPQFLSRLAYWLTPLASRLCAATVCVSDALRRYLLAKWWASERRTIRIYNPVSVRAVARTPDAAAPLVLAVGRLNPQKNFSGLVRAFAMLPRNDARLVILGEGPDRAAIEAEVARLGLGARVSLPGYASEPWRFYGQASCLAVTSQLETFSLVAVEALANGVPVVSTNCLGPEEILDHGRYGTIVPYGDDRAMAQAIAACLANPPDPVGLVARARDFSLEAGLAGYGALFDGIMARHSRV